MLKQAGNTIAQILREGRNRLEAAGVETPLLDARVLLQHCVELDHGALISAQARLLSPDQLSRFGAMIDRRVAREPVSRIIGGRLFFGHWFEVNRHVLDPRAETELLVETILGDHPSEAETIRFADIGTGSGAIALSLLAERGNWTGIGTDISADALAVARRNAVALGVEQRFEPVECDLLGDLGGPFDFIVSNPPYVETGQVARLEPEVRDHDPVAALDGGADGLEIYRRLLADVKPVLGARGKIYLEIGAGQAEEVISLAQAENWQMLRQVRDYAGHVRHLALRR